MAKKDEYSEARRIIGETFVTMANYMEGLERRVERRFDRLETMFTQQDARFDKIEVAVRQIVKDVYEPRIAELNRQFHEKGSPAGTDEPSEAGR